MRIVKKESVLGNRGNNRIDEYIKYILTIKDERDSFSSITVTEEQFGMVELGDEIEILAISSGE